MVNIEKMYALKIEDLMKDEAKYQFPLFMRLIRKKLTLPRSFVSRHLDCSAEKVCYLERGLYGTRGPDIEFIVSLASLYGIDGAFAIKKFHKFMKDPNRILRPESQEKVDIKKAKKAKMKADAENHN